MQRGDRRADGLAIGLAARQRRKVVHEHEAGRARVGSDRFGYGGARLFELHGLAAPERLAPGDDDHAFVDATVVTDEPTNEIDPDPKPYWAEDCVAIEGPTADILESKLGAFKDGADWMDGAWIDWAEQ